MQLILLGFLSTIAIVAANPAMASLEEDPSAVLRGELQTGTKCHTPY